MPHACCRCHDSGFVRVAVPVGHPDFGKPLSCPAHVESRQRDDTATFYEVARIPKRFRGVSFTDFDRNPDAAAFDACRHYIASWPPDKPFLTLESARKGNGKTMLAVCVARGAYERHRVNARFWTAVDLLERYRLSYRAEQGDDGGLSRIEDELRRVPLLIIDDLGAEKGTDWTRERLFSLINARYGELSPTVVTTNVDLGQADERIASRLLDARTGAVITLAGPDRRLVA